MENNEKKTFGEKIVSEGKKHKKVILGVLGAIGTALGIGGIVGLVKHANDGVGDIVEDGSISITVESDDPDTTVEVLEYQNEEPTGE